MPKFNTDPVQFTWLGYLRRFTCAALVLATLWSMPSLAASPFCTIRLSVDFKSRVISTLVDIQNEYVLTKIERSKAQEFQLKVREWRFVESMDEATNLAVLFANLGWKISFSEDTYTYRLIALTNPIPETTLVIQAPYPTENSSMRDAEFRQVLTRAFTAYLKK